jgi:hypothetical protein
MQPRSDPQIAVKWQMVRCRATTRISEKRGSVGKLEKEPMNLENRHSVVGLLPSPAGILKTCMRPG